MNFCGPTTKEKPKRKVFMKLHRSYKVCCWNKLPSWKTSARDTETNQKLYKLNDIRKFFWLRWGIDFLWKFIFKILR